MKKQEAIVDRFWLKMAEIWGHKWGSQYGANANYDGEWAEMLLSLSMQEIAKGLEAEKRSEDKWPSPVPVFRKNAEGGAFDFNEIYETCIYWGNESVLERKGLSRTRECLFIMSVIGAEIKTATTKQAELLVRSGIDQLKKHLEMGNELPDFLVEIDEFPQGEKIGFSLAAFNELAEG